MRYYSLQAGAVPAATFTEVPTMTALLASVVVACQAPVVADSMSVPAGLVLVALIGAAVFGLGLLVIRLTFGR